MAESHATSASPTKRTDPGWQTLRHALSGAGGLGAVIVTLAALAAIFAPWVAPYDPVALDPPARLLGPTTEHWLGTDQYGRDTLSRIVYGGRASLSVAAAATLFALVVGGALGVLAAYYRGWLDGVIMRVTDVLLSFPAILLAIALLAFLGPGFVNLVLAIGLVYVGPFARVARAAVLTVREELFVEASRSLGSRDWRVLVKAVLPMASAPIIVEVTLRLAYGILAEASLSFLGLGTQPPAASWGLMVAEGRRFLQLSPWATVAPGLAIMVVVLGFNLFGDALRDALDPRTRGR
ncbi:MAG: ABC transporter permease [Trueperaceae bacterium]